MVSTADGTKWNPAIGVRSRARREVSDGRARDQAVLRNRILRLGSVSPASTIWLYREIRRRSAGRSFAVRGEGRGQAFPLPTKDDGALSLRASRHRAQEGR